MNNIIFRDLNIKTLQSLLPVTKTNKGNGNIKIHDAFMDIDFAPELVVFNGPKNNFVLVNSVTPRAFIIEQKVLAASLGNGRVKPILCDFCFTWCSGNNATRTFVKNVQDKLSNGASFLACKDLLCSLHVRGLTKLSIVSRAQVQESISVEDRILRLIKNIDQKL